MEIVRNIPDLQTAIGNSTVCHCGFDRKPNGEHHAGHAACISGAKQIADLALVSYFPNNECLNYLFGTTLSGVSWDESYCTNFCDIHGVDIVFIPTLSYLVDNFFDGYNIDSLNTWAETTASGAGYTGYLSEGEFQILKWMMIAEHIREENNFWKKDMMLSSWKDGIIRYLQKDFWVNILQKDVYLIDPIRRADGLAYGTSLSSDLTQDEVDLLVQVKPVIDGIGWEVYNSNQDSFLNTLSSGINNIDADMSLYGLGMSTEGFVGDGNVLVEMKVEFITSGHIIHLNEYYEGVAS